MAKTLTVERTTTNGGMKPERGFYPMGANTYIVKGSKVALDASGNAFQLGDPNFVPVKVIGAAESSVDNTTPANGAAKNASGNNGLSGNVLIGVEYGILGWNNDTGNGAIAESNCGEVSYAKNDQTSSLINAGGALPEGIIMAVGDQQGGGDGKVYILMGPQMGALAVALAAIGEPEGLNEDFTVRNVVTSLQAYTGTGTNVLTETSNGAWQTQDGVTNAVGDIVFIQGGTSNLSAAADAGPWQITSLGGASAKWTLQRPKWFATGAVCPIACIIDVGGEGTLWAGSQWKSFAAVGSAVIGTNDLSFYVGRVTQQVTLTAGTVTISNVGIRTAGKTEIAADLVTTGGTVTGTVGYGPIAAPTPGYIGTGSAVVKAVASGQTVQASDASTLNVTIQNW